MRKAQKQQIEGLIRQMEEAQEQIKKYIAQNSIQLAAELLQDCQTGGITIGSLIEATEGESHPTVLLLEEYVELLYQIYHDMEKQHTDVNENKIYKLLRQKLIKIANSVRNDILVKREAVFLPYKASMWDSLESVWKAADEDANCEAYVIPIPYYDKNPDGSFREMHYEANQYPGYVPVTRYDEYDFGQHHPDMIFIHNPYDALNLVTCVHPFFFAENLKKFTDKLVYIPYFILAEIRPEQHEAIERMKHFCTAPGVYYADQVVVQSEDMRQVYIKVLMEASNDQSAIARKYWGDRILGLGSPKFDRILDVDRKGMKVPDAWLRMIQKPDGSWKKIVFYNMGIGALLQYNEKMLEKVHSVLAIFWKYRDEVALLWRPHPLMKATIESMRPQLGAVYDQLVRKYQEACWGIFDDTADVDRAVALSDAYYGNGSSVVQLCQKRCMPIMIQAVETNVTTIERKEFDAFENCLSTHDIVMVGDDLYFLSLNYNGLYCLHRAQEQLEFLGSAPDEKFHKRHLYGAIVEVDHKLYMPPMDGAGITIYDIREKKFYKIALLHKADDMKSKFFDALYDDGKIFFIPCRYHYIVVLNCTNGEITYLDEWYKMRSVPEDPDAMLVKNGSFIKDHMLYMPSMTDSSLTVISTKNYATQIIRTGSDDDGYIDLCFDEQENCIWLLKRSVPAIEKWNLGETHSQLYTIPSMCGQQQGKYPFVNILCDTFHVYLIAFQSRCSLSMNKENKCFETVEWEFENRKAVCTEWGATNYFAKKLGSDFFLVGSAIDRSFCVIKNGKTVQKFFARDDLLSYRYSFHNRRKCKGKTVREDVEMSLEDFLKLVANTQQDMDQDAIADITTYGRQIYELIRADE